MKSTFLRILVLIAVAAAFLRAMVGIEGDSPASLTTASSNNPAEESFITIWGLSPDGPILAGDVGANSNDSAVASSVHRLWKAQSESDFCVCATTVRGLPIAQHLLAIQNNLLDHEWSRAETETGVWVIGSNVCDCCRPNLDGIPDMTGDGLTNYVIPSAANPGCESSICVEAVDLSRAGQTILIGYGLEPPTNESRGDGGGPDGFVEDEIDENGNHIPEERDLIMIAGPAAIAALDCTPTERALPARNDVDGSRIHQEIVINDPSPAARWWKFIAIWDQYEPSCSFDWHAIDRLPLSAAGRASISSLVRTAALSEDGWHFIVAADDGTLHICYRYSFHEVCRLKQSADGIWRVVPQSNQFLSCDDFTETASESAGGESDRIRQAAIDPFFRNLLLPPGGDQGEIFSFSLSVAR